MEEKTILEKKDVSKKRRYKSWLTTDAEEVELRRKRAATEAITVQKLEGGRTNGGFGDYVVSRTDVENPYDYRVELRSLIHKINTCDCPDFSKNFLGTCKHVEKVIATVKESEKRGSSPFVEVFMSREDGYAPASIIPENGTKEAAMFIRRYLDAADNFKKPAEDVVRVFLRDVETAEPFIRRQIRISNELRSYLDEVGRREHSAKIGERYGEQLRHAAGAATFLRHPLYDYQINGMIHLAFKGRALLADEMGLGKTVQAIAAAHVMRDYFNVRRVLVVSPASLKSEWDEQIRKFTSLSCRILYGDRKTRLAEYNHCRDFFLLTNYEQIMRDVDEINQRFAPDLVILDEAQRIKNWKTKTANAIKRLDSKYAFILTGTPMENRIDELYSIVEFIDNTIFGSLFRFNRQYCQFDKDGKVIGNKNLRELHERLQPVMLRRRKSEISEQLPDRIDNNYFVELTSEQRNRYAEYERQMTVIANAAKRRPLTPAEFEKLQRLLACMRMLCDSCHILDPEISESPKVDELSRILNDIWDSEPDRKIIIFSEWVRMLELVKWQFEENDVGFAWHVGEVPQKKRRVEIDRFKNDPGCKVFLSSDSGGLGLNLQAASVVVNLDLPWNPAKLEQRIARAWRKHQKNTVNVINIIASDTIENRMLGTIEFKRGLADGVLDGTGDLSEFEKPNAKVEFMARLSQLMNTSLTSPVDEKSVGSPKDVPKEEPSDLLRQEFEAADDPNVQSSSIIGGKAVVTVCSDRDEGLKKTSELVAKCYASEQKKPESVVIDQNMMNSLRKLAELGFISINDAAVTKVFESEGSQPSPPSERGRRRMLAQSVLPRAERKLKMAATLRDGGFAEESVSPAKEAIELAGKTIFALAVTDPPEELPDQLDMRCVDAIRHSSLADKTELNILKLLIHDALDPDDVLDDAQALVNLASRKLLEV